MRFGSNQIFRYFHLLPVVHETAERYAEIRQELKAAGTPIPTNDFWIAALARHHRMPILTRDTHFRGIQGLPHFLVMAGAASRMYNKTILIRIFPTNSELTVVEIERIHV